MTAFFLFERKAAKKNAEKILIQNIDNQTIELSLDDYYSVLEEENEIVLNGKYFDISSKKIVNNRIILSGHYDESETKLIDWFDGLPNKKAIQLHINNFLNSLFFKEKPVFTFGFSELIFSHFNYLLTIYFFPSEAQERPPKSSLSIF